MAFFQYLGTGTASIRVKDINDMPPQFTKEEWFTEVDETEGPDLPEMPILTVTVHDEDETNKFQYKVLFIASLESFLLVFFPEFLKEIMLIDLTEKIYHNDQGKIIVEISFIVLIYKRRWSKAVVMVLINLPW